MKYPYYLVYTKYINRLGLISIPTLFIFFLLASSNISSAGGVVFNSKSKLSDRLKKPKNIVLSIGINEYRGQKTHLNTPVNDAKLFHRTAINTIAEKEYSYLLTDHYATRKEILSLLNRIKTNLPINSQIILFWSGMSSYDSVHQDLWLLTFSDSDDKIPSHLSLNNDVLPIFSEDDRFILIADGCHIGDAMINKISYKYPYFAVLGSSKKDELAMEFPGKKVNIFTEIIVSALTNPGPDFDGDGFISLEEIYIDIYPKLVSSYTINNTSQHPSLSGERVHRLHLMRAPPESMYRKPKASKMTQQEDLYYKFYIDDFMAKELNKWPMLRINSNSTEHNIILKRNEILLDREAVASLGPGLNVLSSLKHRLIIWRESKRLQLFETPYKNSHAILVAIDDYDRQGDEEKRGKTGFRSLSNMVNRSKELSEVLQKLGFPKENIHELYDSDATTNSVERLLKNFWTGGAYSTADRLIFYFGGHGDLCEDQTILITYDYDSNRPTLSSVGMLELTGRHARNVAAHHMLLVIDSCFSGYSLALGKDEDIYKSNKFRRLSIIRAEVEQRARNILVAGTGSQEAVWKNGGIFTEALIRGLKGEADQNNDGLFQFFELYGFIKNEVTFRASQTGINQVPIGSRLTAYGTGSIIFWDN